MGDSFLNPFDPSGANILGGTIGITVTTPDVSAELPIDPPCTHTGRSVVDSVLRLLEESTASPVFWSRPELLGYLNDGLIEMNLLTGKFQSEDAAFVPVTTTLQDTPNDAIAVLHVVRSGEFVRKRTMESMDRENPAWMLEAGNAGIIKHWGQAGLNLFFVHPRILASGPLLSVVTLDMPPTIGEDTVIPLDAEYIGALEDYVFHMARFKEGGAEFQQSIERLESFRSICGELEQRKLSEQYELWTKEPNAESGPRYATANRS